MKLALFALVAVLCMFSVNAETSFQDVEAFGATSTMYDIIKLSLQSVKGLHCLIDWTIGIQKTLIVFNEQINACGESAVADFANVLKIIAEMIKTTDKIINLSEKVCKSETEVTARCSAELCIQIFKLVNQTKDLVEALEQIPKTPTEYSECMGDSTNEMIAYFTNVQETIISCSKLTSK